MAGVTSSPEQPEHEEALHMADEAMPAQAEALAIAEHEEARRLAGKLLTGNERELARASWANGVVADPNIPKWGNLVLEAYDAAAGLLSKTEQERDEALHSVVGKHELEQARAEAFLLKGRAEAAEEAGSIAEAERAKVERKLERLREILARFDWDAEVRAALSADTQREDG